MKLSRKMIGVFLTFAITANAAAQSEDRSSQGSADFSQATSVIVGGSLDVAAGGLRLVVATAEIIGNSLVVVLRGASDASEVVLNLSADAAGAFSVAVGTAVQVVAESTGYLIIAGGKTLAYVPNEIGRSLICRSPRQSRS